MRVLLTALVLFSALWSLPARAEDAWTDEARALLDTAYEQNKFDIPAAMKPRPVPMENGRSFFLVWTPEGTKPEKWIVSMPGTHGVTPAEFAHWAPSLQGRTVGIVEVQWWLGQGDGNDSYLKPSEIYRELSKLLPRLGVKAGDAMLHGFSRGSANVYAVAALDHAKGGKFFSAVVANSGGAAMGYPPTRDVDQGKFGELPFEGQQWVTVCGFKDQEPERDGCPAMQRTAEWLKSKGARIAMAIEDPDHGHGSLHTNPANTKRLLDWYLQ